MKHFDQLTKRITLELASPVGGSRVLQRLYQHSWEPLSTSQLLQLPSKTESPSSCRPTRQPKDQTHGSIRNPNEHCNAHKASRSGAV